MTDEHDETDPKNPFGPLHIEEANLETVCSTCHEIRPVREMGVASDEGKILEDGDGRQVAISARRRYYCDELCVAIGQIKDSMDDNIEHADDETDDENTGVDIDIESL